MKSYLLLLLILSGTISYTMKYSVDIDKELKPFYDESMFFIQLMCKEDQYIHPRQLEIKFSNLEYPEIGVCRFNYMGRHIVEIDKRFWNRVNIADKKNLFFHEFIGHCSTHQGHSLDPNSFMYASFNHLEEKELDIQVIKYLKEHCK